MKNLQPLLIVDDEIRVLEVLVKTFESDYKTLSANNGFDALEILKQSPVKVIITDERMPKMNGMAFLRQARLILPNTVNIILTAYTDLSVAIDAINSGIVYRYLVKPWDTDELRITIRQAFERFDLLNDNKNLTEELLSKNRELEHNICELKETQDKLLRTEKLAVVGQLTASIGHELRNPLSRIKTAAALMKNEITDGNKETAELLKIVDNEVMVSTKIINDLLDFSRERKPSLKPCDLNEIITGTLNRLRFPDYIHVEQQLDKTIPELYLDDGQIQQILVNLILNSIQSIDDSGKIYIKTILNKEFVDLTIKDTGCGIPQSDLEKMFEPLFTTKPKGIGLGMSIVKMLLESHGGTIQVQSRENIGTTVTIKLPLKPNLLEN
ncbi:response regulator [bacterium]|nr:response regulator [bacterium]